MRIPSFIAALSLMLVASVPAAAQRGPAQADGLHGFLQRLIGANEPDSPGTRYVAAFADLNGDGRREAILYVSGPGWCGTGGCHLWILTPQRGSWRSVGRAPVANAPIRILSTSTRGWRDIGVLALGGGGPRYEARLRFNGSRYPLVSRAPAASANAAGRTIITDDQPARPLFP